MDELRVRVHADLQTSTVSVEEAAAALGQSTDVVWRYVRAGDLAHIRVQGSEAIEYRILAEDVHDLQAKLRNGGVTALGDKHDRFDAPRPDSTRGAPSQQPIGKRLASTLPEGERPSMAMMRPPTGPLKAQAATITHAGGFGPVDAAAANVAPEVTAHLAHADTPSTPAPPARHEARTVAPSTAAEAPARETWVAGTPVSDATGQYSTPRTPQPAVEAAPTRAAVAPDNAAREAFADEATRTARPALPPISSLVTISGTALHRIGHGGFNENDAMRLFQTMMESLVAPITAANERLADENTRLLELARMQSQALDKASAEREALLDRLAVLPTDMQKLYERLGALQAEVQRLERENVRQPAPQEVAWKHPTSWWRRLFGLD